jgi:hypothetical protein
MLDVHSDIRTALEGEHAIFAWLLELGEGTQALKWTTHASDVSAGGKTYSAAGQIQSLPAIVRQRDIKLQAYTIRIVGSDRLVANSFRTFAAIGLPASVSLVLLADDGSVIGGEAIELYKGTIHSWRESEEEGSATVELKVTSPWSRPRQTTGRLTSTSAQQDRYVGDKFFEFAHVEKSNLGWGGKA